MYSFELLFLFPPLTWRPEDVLRAEEVPEAFFAGAFFRAVPPLPDEEREDFPVVFFAAILFSFLHKDKLADNSQNADYQTIARDIFDLFSAYQ